MRDSEMFANVFTLPATPGQPQDGSSDEHPIFLHGEKSADLEAFLSLLYPEFTPITFRSSICVLLTYCVKDVSRTTHCRRMDIVLAFCT